MIILNQEQQLIKDTVSRFVTEQFDLNQRLKIAESKDGFYPQHWKQFADLGLLGIAFAEEYGGFGGSLIDVATICQQQTKALLMSPYLTTVGTSGSALMLAGNSQQKMRYLSSISSGEEIISCGLSETGNPDDQPRTRALASSDGYIINGCKPMVPFAAQANNVIISCMTDHRQCLMIVPTDSTGIRMRPYKMYDGSRSADLEFSDVMVPAENLLTQGNSGVVQQIIDIETALQCAEASSIMWAVHDQTLDYMKIREQFGQTLSSMQALQHRIVDVYVICQLAQSMAEDAIMAIVDECDAKEKMRRVSAAKLYIAEHGRETGKEGIQLHGGIGMTNEISIGHYFKRLTALSRVNGDTAWHQNRLRRCDTFQDETD